jgi:hypothetical protein
VPGIDLTIKIVLGAGYLPALLVRPLSHLLINVGCGLPGHLPAWSKFAGCPARCRSLPTAPRSGHAAGGPAPPRRASSWSWSDSDPAQVRILGHRAEPRSDYQLGVKTTPSGSPAAEFRQRSGGGIVPLIDFNQCAQESLPVYWRSPVLWHNWPQTALETENPADHNGWRGLYLGPVGPARLERATSCSGGASAR